MAFDQPTRNRLARFVGDARRLVANEFTQQFQSLYGIASDGAITPSEQLGHLDEIQQVLAARLRERVDYLVHTHPGEVWPAAAAVARLAREQAFTVLNRLAAIRMAEKRGLIVESVGKGYQSRGFQVFSQVAGSGLGEIYARYRRYLFCLFDELAVDLGILFDRRSPAGLLFPREKALLDFFDLLNAPDLEAIWTEDETIGWIYQYYNDPAERKRMREQSAAPRNSRELAVRNQFFTPRYVVEFLTDNTLGRLWYEMTKGQTRLKEQCRYLVRRPHEVFLGKTVAGDYPFSGAAWIKEVAESGDFSRLPENPTIEDLSRFALLIDGYEEIERWATAHGIGGSDRAPEIFSHEFYEAQSEASKQAPTQWKGTALELWCILFLVQRGPLREGWKPCGGSLRDDTARDDAICRDLWAALRSALQHPPADLSQEDLLKQPVFIPHRPIKAPREIRLLDPACGSMHFGLYAFDLFETIYAEAWDMGLVLADDFGGDMPPFPHGSVRVDRRQKMVHSNDLHQSVAADTARVVMLNETDSGDGMFHTGPFITDSKRKFRPGTLWDEPLTQFDYADALASGQFTPDAGERLVRETPGVWEHDRIDPLPAEEVLAGFRRDVPRLILEHNIHGIDIDPRAVQIAGLSLWLRAQRAWQEMGLRPAERPRVRRANVVCAEPMPGERELLREFTARLRPTALGGFVERVFERMRLAGEAGALLKIEEEITAAVTEAKARWQTGPTARQEEMFAAPEPAQEVQGELPLDVSGITDKQFFERAEAQIYEALRAYADEAANGDRYQRRLFAEDAARGFAFIDLCRQRYDVAVMNPPFGDASLPSKPYIDETYGDTRGDVYKAFVECFHARLVPAGYLGIISSRTGFFLGQSEDWRTRVVLRLFRPIALADLGSGVLDAMVEVAAYVLRSLSVPEARDLTHSIVPMLEKVVRDKQDRFSLPKWQAARGGLKRHQAVAELEHLEAHGFIQRSPGETIRYSPLWHSVKKVTAPPEPVFPPLVCVRALAESDKGETLRQGAALTAPKCTFVTDPGGFLSVPGCTFSYWVGPSVRRVFSTYPRFKDGSGRNACMTNPAGDDMRYFRASWEVPEQFIGRAVRWVPLAKGGAFSPFYSDVHLLVDWDPPRETYRGFIGTFHRPMSKPASLDFFFRAGLTWPRRTTSGLAFRALPAGCIFADKGPIAVVPDDNSDSLLTLLALGNSKTFGGLVGLHLAAADSAARSYEVGVIQRTPLPPIDKLGARQAADLAHGAWSAKRSVDCAELTSHAFVVPSLLAASGSTLAERAAAWVARVRTSEETVAAIQAEIDDLAFRLYGLHAADRAALTSSLATEATGDAEAEAGEDEEEEATTADASALAADLLAYALGCAFGRWDIRYATGESSAPPIPDPFAPLPVCPPGMLQNAAGLPAAPGDMSASYPARITWPGILVDDLGHPEDVDSRIREILEILWSDRADAIEQEAVGLLGVRSLRDYCRRPVGFFADHLRRYSKSRRQAPIYWPLSTASGSYTLWIYYHRLTDQTLHTAIADFLDPKLKALDREIAARREPSTAGTSANAGASKLGALLEFREELATLRAEIEHVIALPWQPNLNDGVLITASPLWRLFRLGKWQKDLKACWESLSAGEYDWAHLAYSIWPDRVREKCRTDRSLAITHNLEELCIIEPPKPKVKRAKKQPSTT